MAEQLEFAKGKAPTPTTDYEADDIQVLKDLLLYVKDQGCISAAPVPQVFII